MPAELADIGVGVAGDPVGEIERMETVNADQEDVLYLVVPDGVDRPLGQARHRSDECGASSGDNNKLRKLHD